jgi:hypothetical protein
MFLLPIRIPRLISRWPEALNLSLNSLISVASRKGLEPPTYGLGNRWQMFSGGFREFQVLCYSLNFKTLMFSLAFR